MKKIDEFTLLQMAIDISIKYSNHNQKKSGQRYSSVTGQKALDVAQKQDKDENALRSIFEDEPEFEVISDYVAPPMTEDRIMWFGRGMRSKGPMLMDAPTQKFRIGAYIFKDPISWDDEGNFIVKSKKYTPKQVFTLVQTEYRHIMQ